MAYANVQNSGAILSTSGTISWTPSSAPTLNNLLTARLWCNSNTTVYGATDTKDSSGTPKSYNQDVVKDDATSHNKCSIYSLIVPSGLTTPLKNTSAGTNFTNQGIFDEWSGNATSSVLDATNSSIPAAGASPQNGASITTGASAGIALTVFSVAGNGVANDGITDTGTSFSQDAVSNNSTTFDSGEADRRTASVVSATLNDQISWTSVGNFTAVNVIASYKLPPAGGGTPIEPPMRTLRGVGL